MEVERSTAPHCFPTPGPRLMLNPNRASTVMLNLQVAIAPVQMDMHMAWTCASAVRSVKKYEKKNA